MSAASSDESADSDVEAAEILRNPPSPSVLGLWAHAARVDKKSPSLSLVIGVMFSRRGERFASRSLHYQQGRWTDHEFAHALMREYRHMKIEKVGVLQYFVNHKRIAFVHILKFQAFAHPDYRAGKWMIVAKQPIEPDDSERARAWFMYNITAKATKESRFFNARTGKPQGSTRLTQYWTGRVDQMIEEGAVISLEIEEAFDRFKIYVMLGIAVFVSLAVGLIYGFLMGNDFATGFSIASWLMTAFGFYATVASILISLPELR
ncbi:hypothetical protein HII31_07815 [Pseudocercospora fuligena]|uniref:Uncharacterized protein n=1 Tax=Pseudocercospora fuligena TaxID=685502 RepID=A0A8H6RIH7_9PEZI|nr:hypothetical protein HII31_07815 [Pseudocercospora fuligena]